MHRAVLAGLFMFVMSGGAAARADEWTKKFALAGKPELRVETNDAAVRVRTGDSKEIQARVVTVGWRIAEDEVRVADRQTGNRVELEVKIPRGNWNVGHRSVRIELTVPREADSEIQTGDGDISVEGVKGETRLTTGDGNVEARSLDGALEATTRDGDLRVLGRFDRLNLKTGDGRIEAEASPGSRMAADWSARTGDGDVVLRLPEGFAADLDAHTGDGRITLDFPVTVAGSLGETAIRGKMNGGGPILTVHTNDGSIRIGRV